MCMNATALEQSNRRYIKDIRFDNEFAIHGNMNFMEGKRFKID